MPSSQDGTAALDEYHKALRAYREGDLTEAEQWGQKALKLAPDSADVVYLLGVVEFDKGDNENAVRLFTQAINLNPNDASAFVHLGAAHPQATAPTQAIVACHKAIALNPVLAEAHFQIGLVYQSQDNFAAAETAYLRALTLDPNRAELHYNLGSNFEQQKRLGLALAKYQAAVELDPHCIKAQLGLARIHEENGEMQQAVNAYQRTIRLAPRTREAHANLGRILVDWKKLEEARVCYENVLRIDANDADAHAGLGEIYIEFGKIDQAIEYYRRASELGSISARHLLAALTHEETQKAPRQYIEELFDNYSEEFEEHLIETLSYATPKLLYEAFMHVNSDNKRFQRTIDLGCGTGLAGLAFQSIIDQLDGVDLSPEMLKKARDKEIYTSLYTADIVDCLHAGGEKYDLFIAADVLIYIGNLTPVFLAVKERASQGAYFVFSIESSDRKDFELQYSGRYTHSEAYIRAIAQAHQFTVLRCRPASLRKEGEEWVNGKLFILRYLPATS